MWRRVGVGDYLDFKRKNVFLSKGFLKRFIFSGEVRGK